MNRKKAVKTLILLNSFYLMMNFSSECEAQSYFQALLNPNSQDPKTVMALKNKTYNTAIVNSTNDMAKAIPSPNPADKNITITETDDEIATSTQSKTSNVPAPPPAHPRHTQVTAEKVVDVNKDNVPDELIFPDDSEKSAPAKK